MEKPNSKEVPSSLIGCGSEQEKIEETVQKQAADYC
jgi:hypothetical protein